MCSSRSKRPRSQHELHSESTYQVEGRCRSRGRGECETKVLDMMITGLFVSPFPFNLHHLGGFTLLERFNYTARKFSLHQARHCTASARLLLLHSHDWGRRVRRVPCHLVRQGRCERPRVRRLRLAAWELTGIMLQSSILCFFGESCMLEREKLAVSQGTSAVPRCWPAKKPKFCGLVGSRFGQAATLSLVS